MTVYRRYDLTTDDIMGCSAAIAEMQLRCNSMVENLTSKQSSHSPWLIKHYQ